MDGTILDNVKAHVRATEAILRDLGRRDIDPREFHAKWDEAMFPFHSHVERAHRFSIYQSHHEQMPWTDIEAAYDSF